MAKVLRDPSRWLLLGLIVVLVAGCGGDALSRCEEELSGVEAENVQLQEALSLAQTAAAAEAAAATEGQGEEPSLAEGDLSWVRDSLWNLFHDQTPALWECDEGASRVIPVEQMPSATPEDMVAQLNERFQTLNPSLESPGLTLEQMEGDTAVVSLAKSNVVTEQMGSAGAQCYMAGVTFSLTSIEGIDHVRFEMEEGSHAAPGRFDRTDYVYLLPLESGEP